MGASRRWIIPALAAGAAALAYRAYRHRGALGEAFAHTRASSMPSAEAYDRFTTPIMGRFYRRVAAEVAPLAPAGAFLDVGAGPGRLAVRIAENAPDARVTGVDILPDMIERANNNAVQAGVSSRATFRVGDVGALPFPDASFDVVVSTLSMHHWPDPARGLAEVHRVLKPGGVARIYDVASWLRRFEGHGPADHEHAATGPAGDVTVEPFVRVGPFTLIYRTEIRRAEDRQP
jgi:SAM-dependent methyltransferase